MIRYEAVVAAIVLSIMAIMWVALKPRRKDKWAECDQHGKWNKMHSACPWCSKIKTPPVKKGL
jgi:hypothetical protein